MKKYILFCITSIALLLFSNLSFSQSPNGTLNLGILTSFEAYTGAGAVANSGGTVTGDVGTNFGAITGTYIGDEYNADANTAQARFDLFRVYIHLTDLFVTHPGTHAPAFGAGETITPGVYSTGGAGSLGGALTLDGGGNPNAVFVIRFYGAFTVGAGAEVILTNGAKSCNVFWIAEGAISVAAGAKVKGTLFSKVGAVGLGANVVLEGRMLTLDGAITIGVGAIASPPPCVSTIPIFCEVGCDPAPEVDVLGVLSDFALYTSLGAAANTGMSGINGNIGTDGGAISGYTIGIHIGTEHNANATTAQAKIAVDNAYLALMALPNTVTNHAPVFGNGETVGPGVYYIAGAGSLGGTITLDAQGNSNAIFVFKFAGAFSVGAQSKIILANGAKRCNVFWIGGAGVATGAVTIGAGSHLKGTFLSHGGACSSGAGLFLSGRQLSTAGAVNTYSGIIYNNPECVTSTPLGAAPAVALVKTASVGGTGTLGDVITYTFTITNTGNITLTNIVVTDPMVGLIITGSPIASLAAGASSSVITGTYTITQADIDAGSVTNSATATSDEGATDISGTANDNDTPTTTTITQTPAVALVKTASVGGMGTLGDVITYIFAVTNTGNATLTNVVVTDPMVGLIITGSPIASLAPGTIAIAVGTYTITQTDIDAGSVTNSATVTSDEGATDTSGTTNDNDTPTVTATPTPIPALPDFTPTTDIDALVFLSSAPTKDFVVNISEIGGAPSDGQVVLKIPKLSAFTITYGAANSTSNVNGGVSVNNNDWVITEDSLFITMTLKAGVIIGANTFSAIGFSITLNSNVPTQTSQPITVTIVNGSGLDSQNNNNTINTVVKAQ